MDKKVEKLLEHQEEIIKRIDRLETKLESRISIEEMRTEVEKQKIKYNKLTKEFNELADKNDTLYQMYVEKKAQFDASK